MSVTLEQLNKGRDAFKKRFTAIQNEYSQKLSRLKNYYEGKSDAAAKPFHELVAKYFDENVLDKHGNTIKNGDHIEENGVKYIVVDRSLVTDHKGNITQCLLRIRREGESKKNIHAVLQADFKKFEIFA